jgi:6-phosphogluconolactonase
LGVTACSTQDNTIDYVFVANSKNNPGQINVYLVDNKSGVLTEAPGSPYSAGKNPVSLATSPNQQFLYVLNHDDNTIVSYSISSEAGLTKAHSYTTPGSNPTSLKINAAGTYLYVTDAFQPGFSATNPGPGALVVYPINSDGTLGNALTNAATGKGYYPTCNNPVDLTVLANGGEVYIVNDPAGQPPKLANSLAGTTANVAYTGSGACTAAHRLCRGQLRRTHSCSGIAIRSRHYTCGGGQRPDKSLCVCCRPDGQPVDRLRYRRQRFSDGTEQWTVCNGYLS